MHDPLHVVATLRWPIPNPRRRRPKMGRGFLIWAFRDKTWRGNPDGEEHRVPLHRRAFLSPYLLRGFKHEYYLFTLATLWHRDPEKDGTDSSCRNAVRTHRQAAIKQHQFLRAAVLDWWWKHYDWFHFHHWRVQVNFAQAARRRIFTRCATCGGRSKPTRVVNFHVVVDRAAEEYVRGLRGWRRWVTSEANLHHHDCADLASIRAYKSNLPSWMASWGHDSITLTMQKEREPYYGCYPWWREAILGEDPATAAERAAKHVQRSCHPCSDCASGVLPDGSRCASCDGSGFPRVERPIPAELVG